MQGLSNFWYLAMLGNALEGTRPLEILTEYGASCAATGAKAQKGATRCLHSPAVAVTKWLNVFLCCCNVAGFSAGEVWLDPRRSARPAPADGLLATALFGVTQEAGARTQSQILPPTLLAKLT